MCSCITVLYYHWAGALPHWHPVRFRGVDSIVRNDVKLKVCRAPQPHASPVARAISSITRIAVRMRACSHEPPCSHLLTVIGVRPMIAGNTGPRKSTFKSTSTVLPEYQAGVFCPALSHPRTHHPPYTCTHWHCALTLAHAPLPNRVLRRRSTSCVRSGFNRPKRR